jgi:hypothetical protein
MYFLRAIEIRRTTSFGGNVKPSDPCLNILWHVKDPYEYERDTSKAKFNGHFFAKFLLLRY